MPERYLRTSAGIVLVFERFSAAENFPLACLQTNYWKKMNIKQLFAATLIAAIMVPSAASAYWTGGFGVTKVKVFSSGSFAVVLDGVSCSETADGSYYVNTAQGGADRMLELALAAYLSGRQVNLSVTDNPAENRCDVTSVQIQ